MVHNKSIRLLLVSLYCVIALCSKGQSNYIGFYGTVNDYSGGLNKNQFELFRFKYYKPGPSISLEQYLSPFFNIIENASYDWVQYQTDTKSAGVDAKFLSGDLILKYKLNNDYVFSSDAAIAPFIEIGAGATYMKTRQYTFDQSRSLITEETKLNALAGLGFTFRINEGVGFEIASKVYMPMRNGWDGKPQANNDMWSNAIYIQHSAGFVIALKKSLDSDRDGVPDKRDECPGTPYGEKVDYRGCPLDSDGDGIPDYMDRCPTVPGLAMYQGCPSGQNNHQSNNYDGDADGDGVPDSRDKCANTPINTPVDANGCPLANNENKNNYNNSDDNKDSDGDGVPDRIDKCPFTPGPASNRGCPEVTAAAKKRLRFATRGIYFETDKAIIKSQSYPMLNEIVDILNQYPDYDVRLAGHTDNVGGDTYNQQLSQSRVDAVKSYLIDKGIPAHRLEAIGYGKTRPIATNNTAIGRALNRRVEVELYLK